MWTKQKNFPSHSLFSSVKPHEHHRVRDWCRNPFRWPRSGGGGLVLSSHVRAPRKSAPGSTQSRAAAAAAEWCWPALSSHGDVCVVSGTALCGRLHRARSLVCGRQKRKKMGGSGAEREARRKRRGNVRLEGREKIDEIVLIYSFVLP